MLISMKIIWEPSLGAIRPLACRAMGPLASRESVSDAGLSAGTHVTLHGRAEDLLTRRIRRSARLTARS
jgi:hypothetical protein